MSKIGVEVCPFCGEELNDLERKLAARDNELYLSRTAHDIAEKELTDALKARELDKHVYVLQIVALTEEVRTLHAQFKIVEAELAKAKA